MVVRAIAPVRDINGTLVALLDGGVILNRDFQLVDAVRELVYAQGSLPEGSIGTVTIFLDDVRISTNVPLKPGDGVCHSWINRCWQSTRHAIWASLWRWWSPKPRTLHAAPPRRSKSTTSRCRQ